MHEMKRDHVHNHDRNFDKFMHFISVKLGAMPADFFFISFCMQLVYVPIIYMILSRSLCFDTSLFIYALFSFSLSLWINFGQND